MVVELQKWDLIYAKQDDDASHEDMEVTYRLISLDYVDLMFKRAISRTLF